MIKSMTGYGRGEYVQEDRRAIVEISGVNHRYLDLNIRMPRAIMFLEDDVGKYIKGYVSRGKLDISITYDSQAQEDISIGVNETLCSEYVKALRSIQKQFDLIDDISTTTIANLPDVILIQKNTDDKEASWLVIEKALQEATLSFNHMRKKEGSMLKKDLMVKSHKIKEIIDNIDKKSPLVVEQYKQRLHQKMTEALGDVKVDLDRLLMEVAIFSDRCSIDEELTRLYSHMDQLNSILNEAGVVGRKLDFLIQEINREVNTIGSKANDQIITKYVVELKSEIEKMREQVQNIE